MTIKKVNLILTSIASVIYILAAIGIGMIAPLSFMAFDAPGSEKQWQPWVFSISMLSWPIMFLVAVILSWIFYKLKKHKISFVVLLLPMVNAVVLFLLFTTMSFAP